MITFENLSFSYGNTGEEQLNSLDLQIKKGEFVLLCGRSACGKTTATKCVNRSMYDDPQPEPSGKEDTYDMGSVTFTVRGLPVKVSDPVLGKAIASLTPYPREVVLRFYFLDQTEKQIGTLLNRNASTVNYQRSKALRRLKEALEALHYGK